MTEAADDSVGQVLTALADPTRRTIFERIVTAGPLTATSLSDDLPVSRQAISKHLDHLAAASLVRSERVGRETRWSATPNRLTAATSWFEDMGTAWDRRLGALAGRVARDATRRG